jgi:hypothetical protein
VSERVLLPATPLALKNGPGNSRSPQSPPIRGIEQGRKVPKARAKRVRSTPQTLREREREESVRSVRFVIRAIPCAGTHRTLVNIRPCPLGRCVFIIASRERCRFTGNYPRCAVQYPPRYTDGRPRREPRDSRDSRDSLPDNVTDSRRRFVPARIIPARTIRVQ